MSYTAKSVTAALIKVESTEPLGNDGLAIWIGYPHDVDYDEQGTVDCSKIGVLNAKEYTYHGSKITYSHGEAHQVKIECPNLKNGSNCYCIGECKVDAPKELQIDKHYFSLANKISAQE